VKKLNYRKAIVAIILADIIWGAGPPVYKWAFANIHVFTLAFLRFAIPTIILLFLGWGTLKIKKRDYWIILWVGLTNITFNIAFYFIGIQYTESINAPIIGSAGPVFLILGSILFLRDKPTRKMLLGNLLGLTGVLLIVVQPIIGQLQISSFFGNLLLILAMLASVIGTILAKKVMHKYSALSITFWSCAIGTVSFLPFFVKETMAYGFLPNLNFQGVTAIIWGSIFSSLLAYYLLYWALRYIHASEVSVFCYIDPVSAIAIAIPLIHEYPSPLFIIGAFLVFFGVFVAEGRIHYHPIHKLFAKSYAVD